MATRVRTQEELFQIFKDEVVSLGGDITDFSEGSMLDIIGGSTSIVGNEISELIISEFSKTYFSLASGADLELLALDRFGDSFNRLPSQAATGAVTFSRENNSAGNVQINEGTVVKTERDANGLEIRFRTTEQVIMTQLSVDAEVEAFVGGIQGNVSANKVTVVETGLTDQSITVTNSSAMAGGTNELTDSEYRERIRALIEALAGATEAAIRGAAQSAAGVSSVALATEKRVVIDYDISTQAIKADASFFRIPYPVVYVSDQNGNFSETLLANARQAVNRIKSFGVNVEVRGATAQQLNWTASITLNASGPNYSILQEDTSLIVDSMRNYINQTIRIGRGFDRITASQAILGIWGPLGSGDLTAFNTTKPSGSVAVSANTKLIAGTIEIV